jgi:4-hydroxyphenylpyruvate dioxygenase
VELPPRARCLGTEFIEFALDETSEPDFTSLMRGLGFTRSGTHKSKSVTRWSQGGINLVANTEKEGFAHSYYITHGTAVCALGLRVDDATATLRRARGLLDQPFQQAVGPGELEIPAVRGVGGSLIYFTDKASELAKVWDIEFEPTGETSSDAGLTVVDHISQSMHYEEMLTWLLFYSSLLNLDKVPAQDVLDPGGLVKSQVIQSPDGAVRIILNASQSIRTQSSRFLSEVFGSGVQHIALETGDIFATVAKLRENGVPLLNIPENYYDDLEARTGLSFDELDRLKSLNILYDRDGAAEYFQVYTHAFEDRFFFEVVQRRNYSGFGAANAPIRLAAQTRLSQHAD